MQGPKQPMPTYEYRCKYCRFVFDEFQSMTAQPLRRCPECGRNGLQRLIGAGAGIIFKGSGFYATDYGRGPRSKAASTGSGPSPSKDGTAGGPPASSKGDTPSD